MAEAVLSLLLLNVVLIPAFVNLVGNRTWSARPPLPRCIRWCLPGQVSSCPKPTPTAATTRWRSPRRLQRFGQSHLHLERWAPLRTRHTARSQLPSTTKAAPLSWSARCTSLRRSHIGLPKWRERCPLQWKRLPSWCSLAFCFNFNQNIFVWLDSKKQNRTSVLCLFNI